MKKFIIIFILLILSTSVFSQDVEITDFTNQQDQEGNSVEIQTEVQTNRSIVQIQAQLNELQDKVDSLPDSDELNSRFGSLSQIFKELPLQLMIYLLIIVFLNNVFLIGLFVIAKGRGLIDN